MVKVSRGNGRILPSPLRRSLRRSPQSAMLLACLAFVFFLLKMLPTEWTVLPLEEKKSDAPLDQTAASAALRLSSPKKAEKEEKWWSNYSRHDFFKHHKCNVIWRGEEMTKVPDQSLWMVLKRVYIDTVGPQHSTISPLSEESAILVPFYVAESPGKGRGLFASNLVKKGTVVYTNRQTACFPDVAVYRKFLASLPPLTLCNAIGRHWSFLREENGKMTICMEMDEGSQVNHDSGDAKNVGCPDEKNGKKDTRCPVEILKAITDIKAGEEIVMDYGDYPYGSSDKWESLFGL